MAAFPDDDHLSNLILNMIGNSPKGEFPREYDFTQPAKSWWRYFGKQTATNTALCYTCGAVFNRGPKQSTTSLSHHLKMYHREQFINIQQAKDEENRRIGKKTAEIDENEESSENSYMSKKTTFNMALITAIRSKPEIFDPKNRIQSDENLSAVWESIAKEVDSDVSVETVKKRWLQIRDRYRKELKFAIRDNFAYKPKWPYFWELSFLDEHLRDGQSVLKSRRMSQDWSYSQSEQTNETKDFGYPEDNGISLLTMSNILSAACARSPSTASTSGPDEFLESKSETSLHSLQQIIEQREPNDPQQSDNPPSKRPRKTPPSRLNRNETYDWVDDEDMLFGRIVALRLRPLSGSEKTKMKIFIEKLFDHREKGFAFPTLESK